MQHFVSIIKDSNISTNTHDALTLHKIQNTATIKELQI